MVVTVVEAASKQPLCGVQAVARDENGEVVVLEYELSRGECTYHLPYGGPGHYFFAVFKQGYRPAAIEQDVEDDGCHVKTERRTIELRR